MSDAEELAALLHSFDPEWCRHEPGDTFGECGARAKALIAAGVRLAAPEPAAEGEAE